MSQRPLFALSPIETLVSPIRAIRAGSWRLALYTSFLIAVTLLLFLEALRTWDEISLLLPISHTVSSGLRSIGRLGWFFAVPFLLAAVAVPVRVIWFSHTLTFQDLYRETLPLIRRCWEAMRLTKFRFFITAIAIFLLSRMLKTGQQPEILLVFQLCLAASLFLLFHWAFSILVSSITNVGVLYGVQQSTKMLRHKLWPTFLVLGTCGIFSMLLRLWIHGVDFLSFNLSSAVEISLHLIVAWYGITALSVLALEASEAHARQQGLTFRKELASAADEQ